MSSHVKVLLNEFRAHLEEFYKNLKIAPPYNSMEKAITSLSILVSEKPDDQQQQIAEDLEMRCKFYHQAIVNSELHKKHRGIIASLAQSQNFENFPKVQQSLLQSFLNAQ